MFLTSIDVLRFHLFTSFTSKSFDENVVFVVICLKRRKKYSKEAELTSHQRFILRLRDPITDTFPLEKCQIQLNPVKSATVTKILILDIPSYFYIAMKLGA